jgi:hypothetical protein
MVMNRLVMTLLTIAGASSCTPVLLITRPGAPDGTFGPVHTLSVNVATDMKKAVEHSALTGLAFGEIPIPVPIDAAVKSRVVSRLQALGYVVCEAPCGEGSLQVLLTESSVNPELTREGPKVNVRLATHFVVHQNDGSTPYDFTFWANGRGRVDEAGEVIAMLQSGLDISPVVTHRYPVDNFKVAFEEMRTGQSGKVVLDWGA